MRWKALLPLGLLVVACTDPTVHKMPEFKDLQVNQIKVMLKSPDFKKKLEAQRQIKKLPVPARIALLGHLLKEKELATRLLAARLLAAVSDPKAKAMVQAVAKNDPNPIVRKLVGKLLAKPK